MKFLKKNYVEEIDTHQKKAPLPPPTSINGEKKKDYYFFKIYETVSHLS